jgi:hypothetical protein
MMRDNSLNISNTKTAVDSNSKRKGSKTFNSLRKSNKLSKSNKFRSSVDYS